jgi:hypothetical protein
MSVYSYDIPWGMVGMTKQEVIDDGPVSIHPVEVNE